MPCTHILTEKHTSSFFGGSGYVWARLTLWPTSCSAIRRTRGSGLPPFGENFDHLACPSWRSEELREQLSSRINITAED